VAAYVRGLDDPGYRAFAIAVLLIEDGCIVEVTAVHDPGLSRRAAGSRISPANLLVRPCLATVGAVRSPLRMQGGHVDARNCWRPAS
jgi:hypothetical protein